MQPEDASGADPSDIRAYIASMSRQLAEVCVLAGLNKEARLLEDAAASADGGQSSASE